MKYLTVNKPEGSKEYDWADLTGDNVKVGEGYKHLVYNPGSNVKLVNMAEYCKSIIADGEELITGNESGGLVVPELKDGNVYIAFKRELISLDYAFRDCTSLQSVSEDLFSHNPGVTRFGQTFSNCSALTAIPIGLFDNNKKAIIFTQTFSDCASLRGESPYTMVDGRKTHLYERRFHPELFTTPSAYGCFSGCTGLTDYAQIPPDWQ